MRDQSKLTSFARPQSPITEDLLSHPQGIICATRSTLPLVTSKKILDRLAVSGEAFYAPHLNFHGAFDPGLSPIVRNIHQLGCLQLAGPDAPTAVKRPGPQRLLPPGEAAV